MRSLFIAFTFAIVCFATQTKADTPDETCKILAKNLQQNVIVSGSSYQQFEQMQNIVSSSEYETWTSAKSSSANFSGSLSIPDYVDLAIGDNKQSDDKNWHERRDRFTHMKYSQSASSFQTSSEIRKTDATIVRAIVDCAARIAALRGEDFVAFVDHIADDGRSFGTHLVYKPGGSLTWKLRGFKVKPDDPQFSCLNGFDQARRDNEIPLDSTSQEIVCSKDPDLELTLFVSTNQGSPLSVKLPSVGDEIAKIRRDTEASIASLKAQLESILPKNAVVFSASGDCDSPDKNSPDKNWLALNDNGVNAGHFIVVAGPQQSAGAGRDGAADIAIVPENLPSFSIPLEYYHGNLPAGQVNSGGENFVVVLGPGEPGHGDRRTYAIPFAGSGKRISVTPPSLALTPCGRRP